VCKWGPQVILLGKGRDDVGLVHIVVDHVGGEDYHVLRSSSLGLWLYLLFMCLRNPKCAEPGSSPTREVWLGVNAGAAIVLGRRLRPSGIRQAP